MADYIERTNPNLLGRLLIEETPKKLELAVGYLRRGVDPKGLPLGFSLEVAGDSPETLLLQRCNQEKKAERRHVRENSCERLVSKRDLSEKTRFFSRKDCERPQVIEKTS